MVDLDEINIRVHDIQMVAGDPEHAHALEDDLYRDVLESFTKNPDPNVRRKAKAALKTREINFPRWAA